MFSCNSFLIFTVASSSPSLAAFRLARRLEMPRLGDPFPWQHKNAANRHTTALLNISTFQIMTIIYNHNRHTLRSLLLSLQYYVTLYLSLLPFLVTAPLFSCLLLRSLGSIDVVIRRCLLSPLPSLRNQSGTFFLEHVLGFLLYWSRFKPLSLRLPFGFNSAKGEENGF